MGVGNSAFAKYLIVTEPTFQSNYAQTNATNLGLDFDSISLSNLAGSNGATLAASYSTLYLAPGSSAYATYSSLAANGGVLESYVSLGGVAILNVGASTSGTFANVLPGDVDYGGSRQNSGFTVDLSHPFISGIGFGGTALTADDDFNGSNGWNSTSHGFLTDLPAGATVIVDHAVGAQMIEYAYGNGLVIGSGLTFGWGSGSARTDALDNLLLYGQFAAENLSAIPEPGAIAILGLGLVGLTLVRRNRTA